MATIGIYEDQENKRPDLVNKQQANNAVAFGERKQRTVFGDINTNKENNVFKPKNKEALPQAKKLGHKQQEITVFEMTKALEDEERMARIDAKLKAMSTDSVYKGTAEDRFLTKREVAAMRLKQEEEERLNPKEYLGLDTCPVTMKKPIADSAAIEKETAKKRKELFFEMDEYRQDIYDYLRERELQNRAKPGYMKKQPDVTYSMRTILVDWLVEVAEEYKLQNETLYLAINFVDRFLSYMSVVRAKLQLVGTAAMFLAAKYEEIYPPDVTEFVYITDDTYNKRQVIRMEHLILKVLGFDLSIPTPLTFIHAICISCRLTEKTMYLAMYLSELTMLTAETYLEFLPSVIAAAAVAVARHTLNEPAWTPALAQMTGYQINQLAGCMEFLSKLFVEAPFKDQHAIQDKYRNKKYHAVSSLKPNIKPVTVSST